MIGIIDYGMGNIMSVQNALNYLGEDNVLCNKPSDLEKVGKIILPGVGAFPDCINNLQKRGLIDSLNYHVLKQQIPILGICLGMQVMAKIGYELKLRKDLVGLTRKLFL